MTTSATQKGVQKSPDAISEEQQAAVDEARQNTLKARQNEMSELAEQRKAQRDAEFAQEGHPVVNTDEDDDSESTSFEKPTNNEQHDEKPTGKQEQSQNNDEDLANSEKMVKIKVDGKEQEVPLSKILEAGTRTLQKESTADTRLEEATRILHEAKEVASKSQPSKQEADVDDTANLSTEDRKALAKTLIDGDIDQVAEALGKIMGTGRQSKMATQAVNMQPNEVYGMVEGALQMKDAMETFQRDPEAGGYGDLYADETTRQMVFDKEAELAEQDKDGKTTPVARLKQAADAVREWRNGIIEKSGGKVVQFGDRDTKKQAASSTPHGSGGRHQESQEEQPLTEAQKRKKALANMARARGQLID